MDNYNYPWGADDSDAPWNQRECPVTVTAEISFTMSRKVKLDVDDYTEETFVDWDDDDEGGKIHIGGVERFYTDCDIEKHYRNQHYTISELLNELKSILKSEAEELAKQEQTPLTKSRIKILKEKIEDCEGWQFSNFDCDDVYEPCI